MHQNWTRYASALPGLSWCRKGCCDLATDGKHYRWDGGQFAQFVFHLVNEPCRFISCQLRQHLSAVSRLIPGSGGVSRTNKQRKVSNKTRHSSQQRSQQRQRRCNVCPLTVLRRCAAFCAALLPFYLFIWTTASGCAQGNPRTKSAGLWTPLTCFLGTHSA